MIKNVAGIDRHLAAAAGCVDDKLRYGVAGGVTAQTFDNFDSFSDRGAQMG